MSINKHCTNSSVGEWVAAVFHVVCLHFVLVTGVCTERVFLYRDELDVYFRPFRHGGKRTLYLVDTVAVVAQQASYIRHLTDLSVGEYASRDAVDTFDMEDWEQEFRENQVDFTSLCIL
jgi:hypothetical protein